MSASARSRAKPASGPNTSTIGRAGSGRAMNLSMSEAFSATISERRPYLLSLPSAPVMGQCRCSSLPKKQHNQEGTSHDQGQRALSGWREHNVRYGLLLQEPY